jgi:hypothetical protein
MRMAIRSHQDPVAGNLDDVAMMFSDFRIEDCPTERFGHSKRAFFVGAHKPAITDHIGGKDRCKLPLDTLRVHGLPSQSTAHVALN